MQSGPGSRNLHGVETEVKAFMTGTPVSVEADTSALAALDLMVEHGIRHLPVVDGARRVVGVVSFDDLRAALPGAVSLRVPPTVEERRADRDVALAEVMTHAPVTIRYDAPLEEAAERMAERHIGCLPVVDEQGRLDGILSESDLLHVLVTALWAARGRRGAPAPAGIVDSLEREREHLVRQLADYEHHEQEITETRRDTPQDLAEAGSGAEDGWLTERLAELASRRLRAIEEALERGRRGELGVCERCGGEIPEARLRALPGASLCIRCAREAEAG